MSDKIISLSNLETFKNKVTEYVDNKIGNPLIAKSDEEMTNLMVEENTGKLVRFVGTSSTYVNNGIYIIEVE